MTDEELNANVRSIEEGITTIAERLQVVIADYDVKILEAHKRLAELEGTCRYRGMEKLHDRDDIMTRIEKVESKINFLMVTNFITLVTFVFIAFVIFNPGMHSTFMHFFTTVTP